GRCQGGEQQREQEHDTHQCEPTCAGTLEFISIKSWAATGEDEPGMMEGTAEVPPQSADAHLPEAASVFDAATALGTAMEWSIRSRRWCSSWCATCSSRVSSCRKSR